MRVRLKEKGESFLTEIEHNQTGKWTDRQTDRQTNGQLDGPRQFHKIRWTENWQLIVSICVTHCVYCI